MVRFDTLGTVHGNGADMAPTIRYAKQDADRKEYLNAVTKTGARCKHCGRKLTDVSMERHPGLCGAIACKRKRIKEIRASSAV